MFTLVLSQLRCVYTLWTAFQVQAGISAIMLRPNKHKSRFQRDIWSTMMSLTPKVLEHTMLGSRFLVKLQLNIIQVSKLTKMSYYTILR